MTETPNLGVTHIVASQNQKEVTANAAFDALDDSANSALGIVLSDANRTLTDTEALRNGFISFTGGLTANRTITLPTKARRIAIRNGTTGGYSLLVGYATGAKVTVGASARALIHGDGTDCYSVGAGGTGGAVDEAPEDGQLYGRKDGAWAVNPSGTLTGVNNVMALLNQSGNQSLSTGANTIQFGTVIEDTLSIWDGTNHRFVIPSALNGKAILLQAGVQCTADAAITYEAYIERSTDSGATWRRVGQSPNGGIDFFGIASATALVRAATGQWFRFVVVLGSSTKTTNSTNNLTYFSLVALDTASGGVSKAVNAQVGTTYTLGLSDEDNVVTMDNGSANTLTIPANSSVAIAVGTSVTVVQKGAGTTTIEAAPGVTLRGVSEGAAAMSGQWARAELIKIATDVWTLNGEHGAVS